MCAICGAIIMTKKISLYFDPYVWGTLHRMISLLLVSGKPLNELPSMNDLLESAIIFVSRHIEKEPVQLLPLSKYTEGMTVNGTISKKTPMTRGDKGRMAFRTSTRVIDALRKIRETKAIVGDADNVSVISDSVSDAILIRSCVYYLIDSPSLLDFFFNLYISILFDLKAAPLYIRGVGPENDLESYIELLNNEEKENLRMVLWDQSIITYLTTLPSEESHDYFSEKSIRKQGSDPDPFFQSRAFNFNYLTAMIGWLIISHFEILDVTIPEIITNFSYIYKKVKSEDEEDSYLTELMSDMLFSQGLDTILKVSIRLDEDIRKQKSNLNRRMSNKVKDEYKEQK